MSVTNADLMKKLKELQKEIAEIKSATVFDDDYPSTPPAPSPFAVKPVGKINEDGSITLNDGTVQWPNTPTGGGGSSNQIPNITPLVPPEYTIGTKVYFKLDPLKRTSTIIAVGDGVVQLDLSDDLKAYLNNPDHMGVFYPSVLALAEG